MGLSLTLTLRAGRRRSSCRGRCRLRRRLRHHIDDGPAVTVDFVPLRFPTKFAHVKLDCVVYWSLMAMTRVAAESSRRAGCGLGVELLKSRRQRLSVQTPDFPAEAKCSNS